MRLKAIVILFCISRFSEAQKTQCHFEKVGAVYTCTLVNQNIRTENQMENVSGLHLQGMTDENVKSLRQTGSIIKVFPSLIIDRFVNLETVTLNDVGMTSFGQPITNCANLETITLNTGGLTYIPQGILRNCINLTKLILNDHPIRKIHSKALAGLTALQFLKINGADLQTLHPVIFSSTPRLQDLEMKNSGITRIASPFPELNKLLHLILSNNNLTTWSSAFLAANPQLLKLHLDHNQIRSLTADAFGNLHQLQYLSVGDSLRELPVFENLNQLDTLTIERCPLTHVSATSFQNMFNLKQLNLQENQIATVDFTAPTPAILQGLNHLDLSRNRIEVIPDFVFGTLTFVTKLYLQDNAIVNLTRNSLRPIIDTVNILDLSNNPIEAIASGLFEGVTSLLIKIGGCFNGHVTLGPNLVANNTEFKENCLNFEINRDTNF